MIDNANISAINCLIKKFKNIADLFEFQFSAKKFNGAERNIIKKLKNNKNLYLEKAEKELAFIDKNEDIEIITIKDGRYPSLLKNIFDPPPVLYVKGKLPEGNFVAVVGSRMASKYGIQMAFELSRELAKRGVIIISGMATGIDTYAHKGALAGNGQTVAVLGSGLLRIYPEENRKLYYQIVKNGAIVSEFSFNQKPEKYNFPRRNRVISGLRLVTIIVEAGNRSGALITASCALEQGREVFAVPGAASSPLSIGTNRLIKDGARLVQNVYDVLEELNIKDKIVESKKIEKNNKQTGEKLTQDEEKILKYLNEKPQFVDNIFQKAKIEIQKLERILMFLEIKGFAEQVPGHKFRRIN